MLLRSILFVSLALSTFAAATRRRSETVISGQPSDGPSTVQFAAASSGFDGPKVTNLNSTTFDLWYFDAVSSDLAYTAVVVFFTAEPGALFPGAADLGTADYVEIFITTPDDSFVTAVGADSLTVTTTGDGSSGALDGGEAGWTGQPDMSQYIVNINAPDEGITGTLSFTSVCHILSFTCAVFKLAAADCTRTLSLWSGERSRRVVIRTGARSRMGKRCSRC